MASISMEYGDWSPGPSAGHSPHQVTPQSDRNQVELAELTHLLPHVPSPGALPSVASPPGALPPEAPTLGAVTPIPDTATHPLDDPTLTLAARTSDSRAPLDSYARRRPLNPVAHRSEPAGLQPGNDRQRTTTLNSYVNLNHGTLPAISRLPTAPAAEPQAPSTNNVVPDIEPDLRHQLANAKREIIIKGILAFLPLAVLTSVFLGLVETRRVGPLRTYILVNYEPTRLLVPVQIAAAVALSTVSLLMQLWSYRVAYYYHTSQPNRPPTEPAEPSERHITMLSEHLFFAGPFSALISLIHAAKRKKDSTSRWTSWRNRLGSRRDPLPVPLKRVNKIFWVNTALALLLNILAPLIGGLSTTSTFDSISESEVSNEWFGRELPPKCATSRVVMKGNESESYTCALNVVDSGYVLAESSETIRTVYNVSSINQVKYDYEQKLAFLAPAKINSSVDFVASTLGVNSTCRSMGRECHQTYYDRSRTAAKQTCYPFYRGNSMDILNGSVSHLYIIHNDTGRANPTSYWSWALLDQTSTGSLSTLATDPEVLDLAIGVAILLKCDIAVHNYTYAVLNGKLNFGRSKGLANAETANVAWDLAQLFINREVYGRMRLGAVTSNTAAEIAEQMSQSLSEIVVAYMSGVTVPAKHTVQQSSSVLQVASVPLPVVILLAIAGYVLAIEGLVFGFIAYRAVRRSPEVVVERQKFKLEWLAKQAASRP